MLAAMRFRAPSAAVFALAVFARLFFALPSAAIQLRWDAGATNVTAWTDTVATFFAEADSGEFVLPSEWKLLWVAATAAPSAALPLTVQPAMSQDAGTAFVSAIADSLNPFTLAAHEMVATITSCQASRAKRVFYRVSIPAAISAKLQVVTYSPTSADSESFLISRSNDLTINGGTSEPLPPLIFRTTRTREGRFTRVRAQGVGLRTISHATSCDAESTWQVPLHLLSNSDTSLIAEAEVTASLPAAILSLGSGGGGYSTVETPSDPAPAMAQETFASSSYMTPGGRIQP